MVWDKAYNDFKHLAELTKRGVFWVNRAKDNMTYEVAREVGAPKGKIIRDVTIRLTGQNTNSDYTEELRLVEAMVEIKGELVRGVIWSCLDLFSLVRSYGTAEVQFRMRATPESAYLPGFSP